MRLPHLPDPTEGVRDAVGGAAHQFAHVTARVAKHLDAAEHRANKHLHAGLQDQSRHGHKNPLRGSLGAMLGMKPEPPKRNKKPPQKPHYHA